MSAVAERRWICRLLHLRSDQSLIAEYERRHASGAVWPDVVRDLRQRGVARMEIWRMSDIALMVMEVEPDFPRPAVATLQPTVDRWEKEMEQFQDVGTGAPTNDKWMLMKQIFSLADQIP